MLDARTRYTKKKAQAAEKVEELPYAGGELMRAAELETGAIAALTDEVKARCGPHGHAGTSPSGRKPSVNLNEGDKVVEGRSVLLLLPAVLHAVFELGERDGGHPNLAR